jgi:hypothetical protein
VVQAVSLFEIRRGHDSLGDLLGVVEADNVFRAAEMAVAKFFKRQTATRETGWGGGPGAWSLGDGSFFYVRPADPVNTKLKPRKKTK